MPLACHREEADSLFLVQQWREGKSMFAPLPMQKQPAWWAGCHSFLCVGKQWRGLRDCGLSPLVPWDTGDTFLQCGGGSCWRGEARQWPGVRVTWERPPPAGDCLWCPMAIQAIYILHPPTPNRGMNAGYLFPASWFFPSRGGEGEAGQWLGWSDSTEGYSTPYLLVSTRAWRYPAPTIKN